MIINNDDDIIRIVGYKFSFISAIKLNENLFEFRCSDAIRYFNKNGELHREDGPASIYYSGCKYWYNHNFLHRLDGPACEDSSGNKAWYYNGRYIHNLSKTQKEFERWLKLKAFI